MKIGNHEIIEIRDNGGKTADRYTFVFSDKWDVNKVYNACLGTSVDGYHFNQFSSCMPGKHLGKLVKWNELSQDLRTHVKSRLKN